MKTLRASVQKDAGCAGSIGRYAHGILAQAVRKATDRRAHAVSILQIRFGVGIAKNDVNLAGDRRDANAFQRRTGVDQLDGQAGAAT